MYDSVRLGSAARGALALVDIWCHIQTFPDEVALGIQRRRSHRRRKRTVSDGRMVNSGASPGAGAVEQYIYLKGKVSVIKQTERRCPLPSILSVYDDQPACWLAMPDHSTPRC